ncbi:MAG: serine hydrolase domain-containing protein [Candidatus Tumulicola sp.]
MSWIKRSVPFARNVALGMLVLVQAQPGYAAAPSPVHSPAALAAALQRDLNAYLKERGEKEHLSALSMSVSVANDGPGLNLTAGTTRYGAGPRVTPSDLFQIGSNTKAFTAVAVLQLEAQGRLSIDAPIGKYLPEYPAYAKLTLRQLLSMTGGIESYDNTPAWEKAFAANPMADMSTDGLIRLVYPKFLSKPGTKYHYSNTGYLLAQEVVAARSEGHSFSAAMARLIAGAGLKNTYYTSNVYPTGVAKRVVAGYYENDDAGFGKFVGKDVSRFSLSWAQGAGSIVSTPADLVAWARAMYQSTALLPAKEKAELLSLNSTKTAKPIGAATAGDPGGFGLGVAQKYIPAFGTFWFYQGETLGFRAAHLYFPDSNLVVAIFANSRPVEKNSHLVQLMEAVYSTIKSGGKL